MDDLYFFYSAKMAVVFILMLLSATLEAMRNENDKFFDLMTAIGEDFGAEFNDAEKALELDLNGANSFLEGLHTFAIREIVRKNENGEFECKKSKNPDFKMAIQMILGPNMRNLLKAIIFPKQSKTVLNSVYTIKTIFDDKSFKTVEDLLKELSVKFSGEQLFNLLFSLAARLEALVHGKNSDGTLKEKQENSKDKIQTFLAVSKCFILPEWESSIFDYWIEIIEMKTKPIFRVAIYKKKYAEDKREVSKERAFNISKENYKILKQLNDQKFSIYESLNLLRATFNRAYTTNNYGDEATNRRNAAQLGKQKHILGGKIPQIFVNLLNQINSIFYFNWKLNKYWDQNKKCEYAMLFKNVSESLMKMMSEKMIDPKLHLESIDFKIQEYIQNDVEEYCKKFSNEEAKIIFLNNVPFELAINFEFNKRKDVYDRTEDLLSDWVGGDFLIDMGIYPLSEESYLKKNASKMLRKIKEFTLNTNREAISIIEALIGKEFNLVSLFDQIKTKVEVAEKEKVKFWKAKKEINSEQLENDIEFLKKNSESIAEEKYQKIVTIICIIKQFGEKVKMQKSKIKTIEIKKNLKKLSSTLQKNKMKYFGPEVWKQTKDSCNQFKPQQIEMVETVSDEILLADIQFEFNEIWKSIEGGLKGIKEYYLRIPLMQLTEEVRPLAKTFGKMLENVKEHYCQKKGSIECCRKYDYTRMNCYF